MSGQQSIVEYEKGEGKDGMSGGVSRKGAESRKLQRLEQCGSEKKHSGLMCWKEVGDKFGRLCWGYYVGNNEG